jgi:hypothetical protein
MDQDKDKNNFDPGAGSNESSKPSYESLVTELNTANSQIAIYAQKLQDLTFRVNVTRVVLVLFILALLFNYFFVRA